MESFVPINYYVIVTGNLDEFGALTIFQINLDMFEARRVVQIFYSARGVAAKILRKNLKKYITFYGKGQL